MFKCVVYFCVHYVLHLLYKMVICKQFFRILSDSTWIDSPLTSNILQNDFLLKCHPRSEYCMKAARFGVRTPQTKYLVAVLAVSLISSIPAPLWWSGRAVSVQRVHKHSTIFSACSRIDLPFVCCHLPFSSSLFLLSVCRKRGAILNISSASGMYPVPLLTVYSASKVIAIQSIWPFPHLLNWNLIIRDIPPSCHICAAVQRRPVRCLFSLESLLSAARLISLPPASPPRMWTCVRCTSSGSHCWHVQHGPWSVLQKWHLTGAQASCGWGGMTVWPSCSPASEAPPVASCQFTSGEDLWLSLGNLALDFWSSTVTCFCSSYHPLAEAVWQGCSIPRSLFIAFSDTHTHTHNHVHA